MKYIVSRTSVYDDKESPCKGAKLEMFYHKSAVLPFRDSFYEPTINAVGPRGKRKKTQAVLVEVSPEDCVNGYGERIDFGYFPYYYWTINIEGLEGLMNFMKEYGAIVLHPVESDVFPETPSIEIYDDRREA